MGASMSQSPPPPPAPVIAPVVSIKPIPATTANNEPSLFNTQSKNINSAGESIYNNSNSNSGILIDSTKLKNCITSANSDKYNQNNCITTYIKGIDHQNQLLNLSQGKQVDAFKNIKSIDYFQSSNDTLNNQVRNIIIVIFVIILIILLLCKK